MDRNTGRGPPERNRWRRPWRSWELRRPWQCRELRRPWRVVFHGRGLLPWPGHSSRKPSTPPPNFPGEVRGYQEPSGARQTGQYRTALRGQTDRTRHPTGTGSPPWRARKRRLPLGMTRIQGPSQGPSATASTSATGGQTSLRGQDKTRLD